MKLSGGKRGGRHLSKYAGNGKNDEKNELQNKGVRRGKKRSGGKLFLRFITVFFVVIVAIVSVVYAYYKIAVKPPPVKQAPTPPQKAQPSQNENEDPAQLPLEVEDFSERPELVYTFLVLGTDDGNWNTDTLMAVRFDAVNYTVNVVSIPRDTAVNVSWNTKKVNSILSNELAYYNKDKDLSAKERKQNALSATVTKFRDILGFEVDYYVLVNMKAFEAMINAVGGVDYDLPINMNYEDPVQDLYIHFNKGPNHFNGADALKVMRFRDSYASGDIGRIGFQQKFLMSVAEQLLAKKNSLNITTLADVFINHMETDLDLGSVIWLGLELLKLDAENISFDTLPGNYTDSVGGNSYVTINPDEWLAMVNEKLNPFTEPVTKDDVSILYRGSDGKIYVTDGNYAYSNTSWGGKSSSSSSNSSTNNSAQSNSSQGNSSSNNTVSTSSQAPQESDTQGDSNTVDTDPPDSTDNESQNAPEDSEAEQIDDYPTQLGPPQQTEESPPQAEQTQSPEINDGTAAIPDTAGEFE